MTSLYSLVFVLSCFVLLSCITHCETSTHVWKKLRYLEAEQSSIKKNLMRMEDKLKLDFNVFQEDKLRKINGSSDVQIVEVNGVGKAMEELVQHHKKQIRQLKTLVSGLLEREKVQRKVDYRINLSKHPESGITSLQKQLKEFREEFGQVLDLKQQVKTNGDMIQRIMNVSRTTGPRYHSASERTSQTRSTTNPDKRDCSEVLNNDPDSPDGVYIINPDDGIGLARVYCDMSTGGGGWTVVQDCAEILSNDPDSPSGIYFINPADGVGHFRVYCDMTTDGGGWTVFQRRQDGSVDFYKYWDDYKVGFGQVDAEFWLGNDNIYRLTSQGSYKLRIDMRDQEDQSGYATYSIFTIGNEANNYRLTATGYTGDRGDSLRFHNGKMFTTRLRDHDTWGGGNCADHHRSGWWYGYCTNSHLNGVYNETEYGDGITWYSWHGPNYSLKWVEMKLKPS